MGWSAKRAATLVWGSRTAIAENGGGLHGVEDTVVCLTILGR